MIKMDINENDDWNDSEFEEETNVEEAPIEYKPSYVLIAIDTDKSMFESYQNSEYSPFRATLDACYKIVNSAVLRQDSVKGPISIALADNDKEKSNFVDFEKPMPEVVKLLKSIQDQSENELETNFERTGNFDLADFFLSCKNKLVNIKSEAYKKTVIYITCDDNPLGGDRIRRFKVINESGKFPSINIKLIVVTFKPNFDINNLYSEVLQASKSEPIENVNASFLTEKLSHLIQKKQNQRKIKFYPFNGNSERYIKVNVSKPTMSNSITKNMYVTRDTQEEVKKTLPNKQKDSYKCLYNKDQPSLEINEAERQMLGETSVPIGYTLLYVCKSTLPPGWVLTPPYVMQKNLKETEELFEMFWQYCIDKDKCLVCLQKLKKTGTVCFVELIPKLIKNVRQFLVKRLPFAPEINYAAEQNVTPTPISHEEEDAMSNLIDSLTIEYNVEQFQDPVYIKKTAYIKSQLLEEGLEGIDDGMLPDSRIDQLISPYVGKLQDQGVDPIPKRKRNTDYSKARKK